MEDVILDASNSGRSYVRGLDFSSSSIWTILRFGRFLLLALQTSDISERCERCENKNDRLTRFCSQVHPCGRYRHNTVVFILAKEYNLKNLRTIHRLDRLTSGILLFGRTPKKARQMEHQIRNRQVGCVSVRLGYARKKKTYRRAAGVARPSLNDGDAHAGVRTRRS